MGSVYMIGQTLGRYRILEKIGQGGMGVVYRANDERLDRNVALKVLPPGTLTDETARRRFHKEALALAKLSHPNIGVIHDFDTKDGVDFLVMEYIAGSTLAAKLAGCCLPEKEVAALGAQITAALEEAHEHGVVHSDLKPGNVMVTPKGQAKVLDFGLAKLLRSPSDAATTESFTETLGAAGTLPYMAPEQLRGEAVDARTDIHALGVVLYEMATGQRTYTEGSVPRLIDSILHQAPVPPRELNPRVSPASEYIILKCLEKDRESRYQSAKEISVDLRRVSASPAVTTARAAGPPPVWQRRWALAGVVALLLVVVLGAMSIGRMRERLPGRRATQRFSSLAVLPFDNISGDPAQDYFSDSMTEELTTELASLRSLDVISRNSAGRYRKPTKSLREIAEELKVDALIEGSVLRSGDQVRITVQLIDGATDTHLWSRSYDRNASDLLGLQREVARSVAQEIHLTLTADEQRHFAAPPTRSPEAYEAYLRATYRLATSLDKKDDADAAIAQAERAVAFDPYFGEAYVTLARGCVAKIFAWQGGREYDEKAFVALGKALTLNSSLADAYQTRGHLYYTKLHDFDIPRAVSDYRRAISINPNLAEAHHSLGAELTHLGLHDKAIEEFRVALRLDPHHTGAKLRLARALWQSQRFADALEQYERNNLVHSERAVTLGYLGRRKEAWETIEKVAKWFAAGHLGTGSSEDIASARAFLYASEGKGKEAHRQIELAFRFGKDHDHFHHAEFLLAAACAEMGEAREAVVWLKRAAESGMPNYPLFHDNPSMRKLHGDPAYEQFMAQLKTRWDQLATQLV